MIVAEEDKAFVAGRIRRTSWRLGEDGPEKSAEAILNHLSERSRARERAYLEFARAGWDSARLLAITQKFGAPASEKAADEALARIEARLKELEGEPPVPADMESMVALIASFLTKAQLVQLSELVDSDADGDINFYIQVETQKVAPELFSDPDAGLDKEVKHGSE